MVNNFDKHKWLDAVEDDERITPAERSVLLRIGRRYVLNGGNTFRVRQATLADRCRVGERTVRRAIAKGKDFGYLKRAQERQRGRSHRAPDQYRLEMPDGNTGQNTGQMRPEIEANRNGNRGQQDQKYRPNATANNASTCGNDTPYGSYYGSEDKEGGYGAAVQPTPTREPGRSPTPEPDLLGNAPSLNPSANGEARRWVRGLYGPRCPDHANDRYPPGCRGCEYAKYAAKAEDDAKAEQRRAEREAEAECRAACLDCVGTGWIDVDDGDEFAWPTCARCRHPKVAAATPTQREETNR